LGQLLQQAPEEVVNFLLVVPPEVAVEVRNTDITIAVASLVVVLLAIV